MKLRKQFVLFVLLIVAMFICYCATVWYLNKKFKEEAIHRLSVNLDFCRLLSSTMDDKKKQKEILENFNNFQLRLLAKELDMPEENMENIDSSQLLQKIGKCTKITPKKLKISSNVKVIRTKNPTKEKRK